MSADKRMQWLRPTDTTCVHIPALETYPGRILIFNIHGYWRYFPSYEAGVEYQHALDLLVDAAHMVLYHSVTNNSVIISMNPFGTPWIEWLLPMHTWEVGKPVELDWDSRVVQYAKLFEEGVIDQRYTGLCTSELLQDALHICADLVMRNMAPQSWIFSQSSSNIAVYFHNTSSIGVCVPDEYDPTLLVQKLAHKGIVLSNNA